MMGDGYRNDVTLLSRSLFSQLLEHSKRWVSPPLHPFLLLLPWEGISSPIPAVANPPVSRQEGAQQSRPDLRIKGTCRKNLGKPAGPSETPPAPPEVPRAEPAFGGKDEKLRKEV